MEFPATEALFQWLYLLSCGSFPVDFLIARQTFCVSDALCQALTFVWLLASTVPMPSRERVIDGVASDGGAVDTVCGFLPYGIVSVPGSDNGMCDFVEDCVLYFGFPCFQAVGYRESDKFFCVLADTAS